MELLEISGRLLVAFVFGSLIGIERQWRQRLAGLRTNVLVCLGAASFTLFSGLVPGELSPTRVAAQVVSGIGFLGAGVIMRDGLNVRGLNTAATLWCAAAVGVTVGAGLYAAAGVTTLFIVITNVALRPLVGRINAAPSHSTEEELHYAVCVRCRAHEEAHIRALLLQSVSGAKLRLRKLDSRDLEQAGIVEVTAEMVAVASRDAALEEIVGRLSLEPNVTGASWSVESRAD